MLILHLMRHLHPAGATRAAPKSKPVQALLHMAMIGVLFLNSTGTLAQTPPVTAEARAALTVSVTQPQAKPMTVRLQASGNIAPWQEAIISSDVDGLRLEIGRAHV